MRILFSTALTGNLTFSLYYPLFIHIANGVLNLLFVRSSRSAHPSTSMVYLIIIQPVESPQTGGQCDRNGHFVG
jgi:hypothetical protein